MCLAIPGKILQIQQLDQLTTGKVQFGGIAQAVRLDFVPEAQVGDYVLVHVGFAISRLDAAEAQRTFELLQEMEIASEELVPTQKG